MNVHSTKQLLTGVALASALAIVAACSGMSSSSLNPTAPSAAASAGANFSPNPVDPPPSCDPQKEECEPPTCDPQKEQCEPPGVEGCTPGYWKNHVESWQLYTSSQPLTVFGANALPGTLLDALNFGGGSGVDGAKRILLRAAAAALLNSVHLGVDYPISPAEVIADVTAALDTGNRGIMLTLAAELDATNNLGCPL